MEQNKMTDNTDLIQRLIQRVEYIEKTQSTDHVDYIKDLINDLMERVEEIENKVEDNIRNKELY